MVKKNIWITSVQNLLAAPKVFLLVYIWFWCWFVEGGNCETQERREKEGYINRHFPLKFNNERRTKTRLILHERKLLCTYNCVLYCPRVAGTQYFCDVFTNCCCCFGDAICETHIDVVNYKLIYILLFLSYFKIAQHFSNTIKQHLYDSYFHIFNEHYIHFH